MNNVCSTFPDRAHPHPASTFAEASASWASGSRGSTATSALQTCLGCVISFHFGFLHEEEEEEGEEGDGVMCVLKME